MADMKTHRLENESLYLKGDDAKAFLKYMNRERTAEEIALYKEADEFYNSKS